MTETPGGADPHFHKTFSESFYVMEGTIRLRSLIGRSGRRLTGPCA